MKKYLELFTDGFNSTIAEKIKAENCLYVEDIIGTIYNHMSYLFNKLVDYCI